MPTLVEPITESAGLSNDPLGGRQLSIVPIRPRSGTQSTFPNPIDSAISALFQLDATQGTIWAPPIAPTPAQKGALATGLTGGNPRPAAAVGGPKPAGGFAGQ